MAKHIKRLNRDILTITKEPLDDKGIYFWWKEEDVTKIHMMMIGPEGTPYHGGFYIIRLDFPEGYPFKHPNGHFLTQDAKKSTRLHPNLYEQGKICLSLFGTWQGPSWQPTLNLKAIALTLQSLLNPNPIICEPNYEGTKSDSDTGKRYIQIVSYESILVSVVDQLNYIEKQPDSMIAKFSTQMKENFMKHYDDYFKTIQKLRDDGLEGKTLNAPCYGHATTFKLDDLENKLKEIKERLDKEMPTPVEEEKVDSEEEEDDVDDEEEKDESKLTEKQKRRRRRRKKILEDLAEIAKTKADTEASSSTTTAQEVKA